MVATLGLVPPTTEHSRKCEHHLRSCSTPTASFSRKRWLSCFKRPKTFRRQLFWHRNCSTRVAGPTSITAAPICCGNRKAHKPKGRFALGLCVVLPCCFAYKLLKKWAFFYEDFYLYYEDDDLCLRLFQQSIPMVVLPHIEATHLNRGSVKGNHPWRSEYTRGYHHAQSKLIFHAKHIGIGSAKVKRMALLTLTTLILPIRCVFFSPKYISRMVGRWMGGYRWKPNNQAASQQ